MPEVDHLVGHAGDDLHPTVRLPGLAGGVDAVRPVALGGGVPATVVADPPGKRREIGGSCEHPGLQGGGDAALDTAGDFGELGDDRRAVQAAALGSVDLGEERGDFLQRCGGVGIEPLGGAVQAAGGAAQHSLGGEDERGAEGELEGVAAVEEEIHLGPSGQSVGGCLGQQRELDATQRGPGGRQAEITGRERLADRVGDHRGE